VRRSTRSVFAWVGAYGVPWEGDVSVDEDASPRREVGSRSKVAQPL